MVIGKAHVENDGIVGADGREFARHLPGCRRIDRETGGPQVGLCALSERIVVFHEQDSHTGECTACTMAA